jgi:hypothetical protein
MGTSSSSPISSCCLADGPRAGRESKQGGGNADEPCFSIVLQPRREIQTLKNGTVVLQDRAIEFGASDIVARMEVDGPAACTPAARRAAAARRRGGAQHSQATRPVLRFRITTPVDLPVDVASDNGTRHTVEVQLSETNLVHGCTVSGGVKPGSQWGAEKGAYAVVASAFFEVIAYEFPPPREPCVVALTFTRQGLLYDGELVFERASPPGYVAPEEGGAEGPEGEGQRRERKRRAGKREGKRERHSSSSTGDRGRVEGQRNKERKPGKSSKSFRKSRKEDKKTSTSGSRLGGGSSKDGTKGGEDKTEKKEKKEKSKKSKKDRKGDGRERRGKRERKERKRGETEERKRETDGGGNGSEGRGALALAAKAH